MLVVQAAYLTHHVEGRPRLAMEVRRAFRYVNEFMAKQSPRRAAFRVAEFDLLMQRAFMRFCEGKELSAKSTATALTFIAAAVNWCARDQIVMDGRSERQVRILTHPITVQTNATTIAAILGEEADAAPRWMPTAKDMAAFIDAIDEEPVFRFAVIAMNTWARRTAITDFTSSSVDFDLGLVLLNPPGRRQTKKRRPTIRLTDNLRSWVRLWAEERPIHFHRRDRSDVYDAFRAAAQRAKVPLLTPHVIRHFMNSQAIAFGVSGQERSMWLGHMDHAKSPTTEIYEHATPDFLANAKAATDAIIVKVDGLLKRRRLTIAADGKPARTVKVVGGARN